MIGRPNEVPRSVRFSHLIADLDILTSQDPQLPACASLFTDLTVFFKDRLVGTRCRGDRHRRRITWDRPSRQDVLPVSTMIAHI